MFVTHYKTFVTLQNFRVLRNFVVLQQFVVFITKICSKCYENFVVLQVLITKFCSVLQTFVASVTKIS